MPDRIHAAIAEELNIAQVAINNTLGDAEIKALVAGFGYTTAKLNKGKALYTTALEAVNATKGGRGSQKGATAALKAAKKDAHDAYQALAQVARAGLSPADLEALGLIDKEPRETSNFIAAGYTLFDNALTVPALTEFGYEADRLAAERAKIEAYDQANQTQEAAKGTKQQATAEKDVALAALNDWVAQYLKIARVALRGKPQLLEKIGIAARTSKTKAQQAAPKKAAATRAAKKQAGK